MTLEKVLKRAKANESVDSGTADASIHVATSTWLIPPEKCAKSATEPSEETPFELLSKKKELRKKAREGKEL